MATGLSLISWFPGPGLGVQSILKAIQHRCIDLQSEAHFGLAASERSVVGAQLCARWTS